MNNELSKLPYLHRQAITLIPCIKKKRFLTKRAIKLALGVIDGAQLVGEVAANACASVATDAGEIMAANKGTYILGSDLFIPHG